uniref:Zf-C3H1 domain-containing protein n=1 Tax=Elaeophora elaphi TaxID=1147741 RepID=A0A0R3RZN5_9BILA
MNLSITVPDEVTPTAAREEIAVVDPDVASTSAQLMPKKGILKRSSSHSNFPRKDAVRRNETGEFVEFKQPSDQFTDRPTTKIPKLTLTWSEKNAVTIYGDTSDEATTETDDVQVPIIAPISTAQHLSSSARSTVKLNEHPTKIAAKIPFNGQAVVQEGMKSERQTAILYDDEENEDEEMVKNEEEEEISPNDDDNESAEDDQQHDESAELQSNKIIGNSHIAGKWWFGKSTKNIPHCAKWGCTHNHRDKEFSDNSGKYLTPTQQRLKEIHHLRKQLKVALAQLEDKDLHLSELRDQLRDLESVVGSNNTMNEQHQLLLQRKELNEGCEREKQKLIDKHEIRVRQLIKEAVDARAEMTKLQMTLKQLEETKSKVEVKDEEVMTERTDDVLHSPDPPPPPPSAPQAPLSLQISPSYPPSSPQVEHAAEFRAVQIPQDLPLQLQAYENEAVAWRMKAAQLEMVLKDQILKKQQGFSADLLKCRNENERLRTYIKNMKSNTSKTLHNAAVDTIEFERNSNLTLQAITADCYSQQCEELRKQLMEENQRLLEKIEEDKLRLNEYEEDISLLRHTVHSMEEENKKNFLTMEQMSKEIEERTAEVEAANIVAVRLQSEMAIKTKAICYLEERHQVYRNTILDHHLVIKDESTEDWERGFSDPRYVLNVSKRVQTDLTQETLRTHENEFVNLADKLEVLKKEFTSKETSMLERFQEIEKDLLIKSSLVTSLANQLEEADREATRSTDLHQKEREAFQEKLYELGQITENIPILQFEIEKLQQERNLMEYQLRNAKEEYEAGLDVALAESLKKYRRQSNYWAEKVSAMNSTNEFLRNENIALRRSIEELKLRTQVQKADMSKRLTSSINHVSHLKKQLNRSTRDVQIDVHPRVVSKYVACRPNARHKTTDIEKGDLFDEAEERLKLCQGELTTTRRQIAVLQQKLVDNAQTQVDGRSVHIFPTEKKLSTSMIEEGEKESKFMLNNLREQIEELEKRNHNLAVQLYGIETEKQNVLDNQRQQISHYISEFNIFCKELDLNTNDLQEMGRYENERQRLKARIAVLEKVEKERDRLLVLLKNKLALGNKGNDDSSLQSMLQISSSSTHVQQDFIAIAGDRKQTVTDQKIRMKRLVSN